MARLRTGEGGAREATAQAEAAGGDARPGLRARADRETDDGCTERGHVATICDGAETLGPGFGTCPQFCVFIGRFFANSTRDAPQSSENSFASSAPRPVRPAPAPTPG